MYVYANMYVLCVHVFVKIHLKLHSIFDLHKQNLTNDTILMTIIKRYLVCLLTPSQGRRLIPIRIPKHYLIDYNINGVSNIKIKINYN